MSDKPVDLRKPRRGEYADPSKVDRLPPHSIEAEQGVLGCIFLAPFEVMPICIEKLPKGSEDFYDLRHRVIWELLLRMYDEKEGMDLITIGQRLKDCQQLEAVGGLVYLSSLPDAVPSAANITYYLEIVREKAVMRRIINGCTEVVARVYDHEGEADLLLDEVEKTLMGISNDRADKKPMSTMKELIRKSITTIETMHLNKGALTGISTGLMDLDKMTSGLQDGEMIVIAARPSMGKTSLAMNIAEHVAVDKKLPVGVFSLEMTSDSLVLRMLCSRARVNMRKIRDGFLSEQDFPKLTSAAGKLAECPLYIDDSSGLSILALKAKARRLFQLYGIKLFVVDYLQLLHSTERKADNRQTEVANISAGLKDLAKELRVPVVVVSQIGRESEKNKRRPKMSDLRESGAIEQDADLIGLLYDPWDLDDEQTGERENSDSKQITLIIAKQRNGPTGDVNLTFFKSYTRFESAARISGDDLPMS
jgi:replicative DNA helicase